MYYRIKFSDLEDEIGHLPQLGLDLEGKDEKLFFDAFDQYYVEKNAKWIDSRVKGMFFNKKAKRTDFIPHNSFSFDTFFINDLVLSKLFFTLEGLNKIHVFSEKKRMLNLVDDDIWNDYNLLSILDLSINQFDDLIDFKKSTYTSYIHMDFEPSVTSYSDYLVKLKESPLVWGGLTFKDVALQKRIEFDIFTLKPLKNAIFCSQNFKDFYDSNGFSGLTFDESAIFMSP